jgi:large subunit ribosomal protein L29
MKFKDLRERSVEELRELEKSLVSDIFTARFKNFTNRLDDTSSIRKAKKDLARVKTLLRANEITHDLKAVDSAANLARQVDAQSAAQPVEGEAK